MPLLDLMIEYAHPRHMWSKKENWKHNKEGWIGTWGFYVQVWSLIIILAQRKRMKGNRTKYKHNDQGKSNNLGN